MWWPFSRKKQKKELMVKKTMKRVIVGVVIGGAIGSIIGKSLMDKSHSKRAESKEDVKD